MDYEDRQPVWDNLVALDHYVSTHWDGWWVDVEDGSITDNLGNSIVRDRLGNYWIFALDADVTPRRVGDDVSDLDMVLIHAGEVING